MVDGSLDRIVGVVHAKDVVPLAVAGRPSPPLKTLMRRPLFVSTDQTAADVLEMFRSQRGHLAIVVDAFNRTLGVVSRDDLFRHLTGGSEAGA
jgi:CBS domain containing-hemolysin-like protein